MKLHGELKNIAGDGPVLAHTVARKMSGMAVPEDQLPIAAAVPQPQDEPQETSSIVPSPLPTTLLAPTLSLNLSTSLNIPTTTPASIPTLVPASTSSTSRHRSLHSEPVPIFSKSCDCPDVKTVPSPCWATDALQRCEFEVLHSWVCWTSANYGCPSPTRACSELYTPTPITGKNPCELGPNPPFETGNIFARREAMAGVLTAGS
ncbi:hypothetical protein BDV96DRAFT_673604 [Lophiotrema nucula]|uniref:Uncharacterized protein n=1 Tax=Lophiotrema nucula TaxID=690887 RepID=A0A6A5YJA3_9PLEO|nr:hypothetical protein BDV96DRAFT_673604 [Lophiotrema nucula]